MSLILKVGEVARGTYISDCEHKASEFAGRSVKIAGNESLDYCTSTGHSQIIEGEADREDPSKVCQRKMDWRKQPQWLEQIFIISPFQLR